MASTSPKPSQEELSDLVKGMVKEMDGDEFYSRPDVYDESAEEHWFTVDIALQAGPAEAGSPREEPAAFVPAASLRKPWSAFQRLHYLLLADEFGCDDAVKGKLPSLPAGPAKLTSGAVAGVSSSGSSDSGNTTTPTSSGGGGGSGTGGTSINSSSSSADLAQGLDAYLKGLMVIPAVVRSQVFSGFLEEHSSGSRRHGHAGEAGEEVRNGDGGGGKGGDGSNVGSSGGGGGGGGSSSEEAARKGPETAIDFLLQPFEYGQAYVPRRAEHTESIDVLRGESVVWKFEVMDHLDIDFSVTFRPRPVTSPGLPPEADEHEDGDNNEDGGDDEDDAQSAVEEARSPGPRGAAGVASTVEDSGSCSAEAGGIRSRWWARGCDAGEEGAPGVSADGPNGGIPGNGEPTQKDKAEQTVHLPTRYSTGGGDPVQGSFSCPAAGTCILRWDNSFSRLRGKRLRFVFESVTVQTMRAAIEAAGATSHKRRATRSTAAQKILDSAHGEVKVCVTAVGPGGNLHGGEDNKSGIENSGGGGGDGGGGADDGGENGSGRGDDGPGSASSYGGLYYSSSYYRFGRVRRVVADLLRDLGGIVDARKSVAGSSGAILGDGGTGGGESFSGGGGGGDGGIYAGFGGRPGSGGGGGAYGSVDARGVEKLVAQFEILEDEVASVSARRAQSEAQAKVLLANLQKANTRADRLERSLEDVRDDLSAARATLGETETARDEAVAAAASSSARLQTSEEQLLRARREHDLLQAERSVWHVARSGIQEELSKVVAELEQERHRHEDTSRALAKSHESRAHAEAEASRLNHRLEEERGGAGGVRAALAAEREAARLAREEAEDARTAVAELDAAVAELGAQKRVLVAGLRARERALGDRCAGAEARAEEAAMMRRAAEARVRELEEDAERREAAQADGEIKLQRLRAEKKILLAEIRRGGGGAVAGARAGAVVGTGGGGEALAAGAGAPGDREDGTAPEGARGRESFGGSSHGSSPKGSSSPRSSRESVQDSKAALKQFSRQLVHLRERQHHLREDLRADPSNASALRLEADVDRAVQNLEARIRRLLSVVTGGGDDDTSSTGSSPSTGSAQRKGIASPMGNRGAAASTSAASAAISSAVVEIETHSV